MSTDHTQQASRVPTQDPNYRTNERAEDHARNLPPHPALKRGRKLVLVTLAMHAVEEDTARLSLDWLAFVCGRVSKRWLRSALADLCAHGFIEDTGKRTATDDPFYRYAYSNQGERRAEGDR